MLPVVAAAIAAPTHSVVDAGLRSLPVVLPVLDFSTIKNELFPIIAHVFSKTTSLAIKVRGLQAFVVLCGGSPAAADSSGLDGLPEHKKTSSSTALDKYTMQEKIVPLIKVIKTKEPAVMMEALNVLRVVGDYADCEFIAMDILPILWTMSLGPLLNLKQFQSFMDLIKSLSRKVEDEQAKKLQELAGVTNGSAAAGPADDFMSFGGITGTQFDAATGATEDDFEQLVKGKSGSNNTNPMDAGWGDTASAMSSPGLSHPKASQNATFSWSTPSPTRASNPGGSLGGFKSQQGSFRTVTPDLASLPTMTPSTTQFSQPLQPSAPTQSSAFPPPPPAQPAASSTTTTVNWSTAAANPWASSSASTMQQPARTNTMSPPAAAAQTPTYGNGLNNSMASLSMNQQQQQRPAVGSMNRSTSSFSLPPPPGSGSSFSLSPPPSQQQQSSFGRPAGSMGFTATGGGMNGMNSMNSLNSMAAAGKPAMGSSGMSMNSMMGSTGGFGMAAQQQQQQQHQQQNQSSGTLDKYQSLL
jgi:SCY1-like protein 2